MRKIDKQIPDFFTTFFQTQDPKSWDEAIPIKRRLRKYLLEKEQNNQCAYTEIYIQSNGRENEKEDNCHIDHYKKRAFFPSLTYYYENLFVASNHEEFGAKYKDKHIRKEDYEFLINPATDEPNFTYNLSSGEIEAPENSKQKNTIDIFHLNHKILIERRKEVIRMVFDYKNQNFQQEEIIGFIGQFESLIKFIYKNIK